MKQFECHIVKIERFTEHLYKIKLSPNTDLDFKAGQYLSVVMDEKDKRPFSIASAPGSQYIELHIGADVNNLYAMQVIERIKENKYITVEAPSGEAFLRSQSERPKLIIAGGTGFSYAKSIIEDMINQQHTTPTLFFWGCRSPEFMYDYQLVKSWGEQPWFNFYPVLEDQAQELNALPGMLLDQVCAQVKDLAQYDVYIAGRFDMALYAKEKLLEEGLEIEALIGDAFSYQKS